MKKTILFAFVFWLIFCAAGGDDFSSYTIFYGIGQDAFSGLWGFSETYNSFSGQCIDTFQTSTQLWILHHPVSVYLEENDTVLDFHYRYRYYPWAGPVPDWIDAGADYIGTSHNYEGRKYASYSLDHAPLFDLPLDTGTHYLEFGLDATVLDGAGSTTTRVYVLPDGQDFKAFFFVEGDREGTEQSTAIDLQDFCARPDRNDILLTWITESETGNAHFLVYCDGEIIAKVEGAGTTTEQHAYSYLDTRVQAGIHSYAISDVTYGGVEELHEAVEVEVKAEAEVAAAFTLGKAYPNPFNPKTVITMHYTVGSQAVVNIYNFQGELVETLADGFMSAGTHQLTWDASAMPSGIYLVSLRTGNEMQTMKVMLMK